VSQDTKREDNADYPSEIKLIIKPVLK